VKIENEKEFPEFALMEGGPGDALMKRLRLIRPELGAASGRTATILAMLTWLPLLAFSVIEGLALGGARLEQFLFTYAALIVLVLIIFAGTLRVFAPQLFRLKQDGLFRYGTLGSQYTQVFESKWVNGSCRRKSHSWALGISSRWPTWEIATN